VQVLHDFLGLYPDFVPKHCRPYTNLAEEISRAVGQYTEDVRDGAFPTEKESFAMDESVLAELAGESEGVVPNESRSLRGA
jgi:3-methyl-2-oxobutanoate hydroxymethyltransferase